MLEFIDNLWMNSEPWNDAKPGPQQDQWHFNEGIVSGEHGTNPRSTWMKQWPQMGTKTGDSQPGSLYCGSYCKLRFKDSAYGKKNNHRQWSWTLAGEKFFGVHFLCSIKLVHSRYASCILNVLSVKHNVYILLECGWFMQPHLAQVSQGFGEAAHLWSMTNQWTHCENCRDGLPFGGGAAPHLWTAVRKYCQLYLKVGGLMWGPRPVPYLFESTYSQEDICQRISRPSLWGSLSFRRRTVWPQYRWMNQDREEKVVDTPERPPL